MRTTICTKINTSLLHKIDAFCLDNDLKRGDWLNIAMKKQLVKDKILKIDPVRQIKSKVKKAKK